MTTPNGTKKNIPILIAAIAGAIATLILRRMPPVVRAIRPIMDIPHAMLLAVAILCIFSIYWSAAAKDSKPAASSESTASRQLHLFLVNGGVLLLFLSIPGLTRRFLPAGPIFPALGIAIELAINWFAPALTSTSVIPSTRQSSACISVSCSLRASFMR
jgi:hypothetical protein